MNMAAASSPISVLSPRLLSRIDSELLIGVVSAVLFGVGLWFQEPALVGAGGVGVSMVCRNLFRLALQRNDAWPQGLGARWFRRSTTNTETPLIDAAEQDAPTESSPRPRRIDSTGDLIDQMLEAGRYTLLLRPETAEHLGQEQSIRAIQALDESMALTPAGSVLVGVAAERATLGHEAVDRLLEPGLEGIARVEPFYLDRYAVTNRDFQHFVHAGGYDELEFWPEEALPALFDFVDSTGDSGPCTWEQGRYLPGEGRLPVVGISWYEAIAYARWIGKRLPTDAEWTKAGAWPIESSPGRIAQRRYPWGEAFDARRANLWHSGLGRPAAVEDYAEGATVGGVEQMIGNVWEWTTSTLNESTPDSVKFPSALRNIRGGAFNTYFENQATCHFQSAEHPLARRNNIGVRLAVSMNSLATSSGS